MRLNEIQHLERLNLERAVEGHSVIDIDPLGERVCSHVVVTPCRCGATCTMGDETGAAPSANLMQAAIAWGTAQRAAIHARDVLGAIRNERSAELTRIDALSKDAEKADKIDPQAQAHRADMKIRHAAASNALVPLDQAEQDLREALLATALKLPVRSVCAGQVTVMLPGAVAELHACEFHMGQIVNGPPTPSLNVGER